MSGRRKPPTAEALMRSRYAAFATGNVDYILDTIDPSERANFDARETARWAEESRWLGLEVLETVGGDQDATEGTVEFLARYERGDEQFTHHELGRFIKRHSTWYYADGKALGVGQVVNHQPKIGRNDPCPCGSGLKYKKCCAGAHA